MLEINMIPRSATLQSVRSLLLPEEKQSIKDRVLVRAKGECEICSAKITANTVVCQEEWLFDMEKGIQKLSHILGLCSNCATARRTNVIGTTTSDLWEIVNHFCAVNGCSPEDAIEQMVEALEIADMQSTVDWVVDLSRACTQFDLSRGTKDRLMNYATHNVED